MKERNTHDLLVSVDEKCTDPRTDVVIFTPARGYTIEEAREYAQAILRACSDAGNRYAKRSYASNPEDYKREKLAHLPDICINEPSPGYFVQRRIVAAAAQYLPQPVPVPKGLEDRLGGLEVTPLTIVSSRHFSPLNHVLTKELKRLYAIAGEKELDCHRAEQGFIDQFDHYWNRTDAMVIAEQAGQVNATRDCVILDELYSENLY